MEKEKEDSFTGEGSNSESSSDESTQNLNVAQKHQLETITKPEHEAQKQKLSHDDNRQNFETDYDWNENGSLSLIKDSYISPDTSSNQIDSSIDIADSLSHKVECLLNDDHSFPKSNLNPSQKSDVFDEAQEVVPCMSKQVIDDIDLRLADEYAYEEKNPEVEAKDLSPSEVDVCPDRKHNLKSCAPVDPELLKNSKELELPISEVTAVTKNISGVIESSDDVAFEQTVYHSEITLPVSVSHSRNLTLSATTSEHIPVLTEIHCDTQDASNLESITSDDRIIEHQTLHSKYREIHCDDKNINEVTIPQESKELSLLNLNEYEQTDHRTSPLSIASTASSKRLEWDNGFDIGYDASKLYPFMFKAVISNSPFPKINSENGKSEQDHNFSNIQTVKQSSSIQSHVIPTMTENKYHENTERCSRYLPAIGKITFDIDVQVAETGCGTEELKSDSSSEEDKTDFVGQSQSDGSITNCELNPKYLDENQTFPKGLDEEIYEQETLENTSKEKSDDTSSDMPINVASDYTLSGKKIFYSQSIPGVPFQCLESHIIPTKACVLNNSSVSSEILQQVRAFFEVPSAEHSETETSDQTPHIRWYPLMSDHHMQDIKNVSTQTAASFLSKKSESSDTTSRKEFGNAGSQFNEGNTNYTNTEFGNSQSPSTMDIGDPPFERMEGVGKCQTPPIIFQISSPSESPLSFQLSEDETRPQSHVDDQERIDDLVPIPTEVNAKPETYVLSSVHLCKEHDEYLKRLAKLSLNHSSKAQNLSSVDSQFTQAVSKESSDEGDSLSHLDEMVVSDHSKNHFNSNQDIDKDLHDKAFVKRNLPHTNFETNQARYGNENKSHSSKDTEMTDLDKSLHTLPVHSSMITSEDVYDVVDVGLIDKDSFTSSESLESLTQSLTKRALKSDDDTGTSSNENTTIQSPEINNLIDWIRKKNKKFKNVLNHIKAEQNIPNYHSKKSRKFSSANSSTSLNMKNKINTILIDTVENTKLLNYFLGNCKKSDFNSRLCALRIEVALNELYEAYESALDILKSDNIHQLVLAHSKNMSDHSLDHSVRSTPVFHSESKLDNDSKMKSDTQSLPDTTALRQGLKAIHKEDDIREKFKDTNEKVICITNNSNISEQNFDHSLSNLELTQNLNNDSILKVGENSLPLTSSHESDILNTDLTSQNDTKWEKFYSAQSSSSSGLFNKIEPSSIDSRLQVLSSLEHIGWIMDKIKKHKIILNYVKKKISHFKKKYSKASVQDNSVSNALQSIKYKLYTVLIDSIDNTRLLNYFIVIANKAEFHSRLCSLKACMALKDVYEIYESAFRVWSGEDLSRLIEISKNSSYVYPDEKHILHPSKIQQKIELILNQSRSSLDLETHLINSKRNSDTLSKILNSSDSSNRTQNLICDFKDTREKNSEIHSSSSLGKNKHSYVQSHNDNEPHPEYTSLHQTQSEENSKLKVSESNCSASSNSSILLTDNSVNKSSSSSHKHKFSSDTSTSLLASAQGPRKNLLNSDLHRSYSAPATSLQMTKENYSQTSPVTVPQDHAADTTASVLRDHSRKSNSVVSSQDHSTESTPSSSKDTSKKSESLVQSFSNLKKSSLLTEHDLNTKLNPASLSYTLSNKNSSALSTDLSYLSVSRPSVKSSELSPSYFTSSSSLPLSLNKQSLENFGKPSSVLHEDKSTSVRDILSQSCEKEKYNESSTKNSKKEQNYSQTSPVTVLQGHVADITASALIDHSRKSHSVVSSKGLSTEATPSFSKDTSKKSEISGRSFSNRKESSLTEHDLNTKLRPASLSYTLSNKNSSALSHNSTGLSYLSVSRPSLKSSELSHSYVTSSSSLPLSLNKQSLENLGKPSAVLHEDKSTSVRGSLSNNFEKEKYIESLTKSYKKGKIVQSVRGENIVVIFEKINSKRTSRISSSSSNEDRVFVSNPLSLQEAFNKERPGFAEESLARASRFDRQFDMNERMTYWKVVMAQNGINKTRQNKKDTANEMNSNQKHITSTKPMVERMYGSNKKWPDTLSKKKTEEARKKRLQTEGRIMTKLFSERLRARALHGEVDIGLHDRLVVD